MVVMGTDIFGGTYYKSAADVKPEDLTTSCQRECRRYSKNICLTGLLLGGGFALIKGFKAGIGTREHVRVVIKSAAQLGFFGGCLATLFLPLFRCW